MAPVCPQNSNITLANVGNNADFDTTSGSVLSLTNDSTVMVSPMPQHPTISFPAGSTIHFTLTSGSNPVTTTLGTAITFTIPNGVVPRIIICSIPKSNHNQQKTSIAWGPGFCRDSNDYGHYPDDCPANGALVAEVLQLGLSSNINYIEV